MDTPRDHLSAILGQMRELAAYSGTSLMRATVEGLAREALDIVAQCGGTPPREATAVGFVLLELTEADLMSGRRFEAALPYWLVLGPVGWCIATSYLFKNVTYFPVCERYLNTLPAADRWRLLQQIFSTRMPRHQALDEWVLTALHADDDAEDMPDMAGAIAFLEEVAASGAPLRLQVKGALTRMGAGKRLDILLRNPVRKTSTASLARAALALRVPLAPDVLAEHVASAVTDELAPLFALAASTPQARDAPSLLAAVEQRLAAVCRDGGPALMDGLRAFLALAPKPKDAALTRLLHSLPGLAAPAYAATLALAGDLHDSLAATLPNADKAALDARTTACCIKAAPDIAAGIAQTLSSPGQEHATTWPGPQAKALALLAASHANRTYAAPMVFERLRPTLPATGEADKRRLARGMKDASKTLAVACGITGNEIDPAEVEVDMAMDGVGFDYRALMAGMDASGEIKDLDLADAYATDVATSAKQCIKWNLRGSVLKQLSFDHCTFQSVDGEGALLEGCHFTHCRFDKVWLGHAVCIDCVFESCTFDKVDSPAATFVHGTFSHHAATKWHAPEAAFVHCALSWCDIRDADLSHACLLRTTVASSRFAFAIFNHAACIRSRLTGVEWIACLFQATDFERTSCLSSDAYGCVFTACTFMDVVSDEPAFLENERLYLEHATLRAAVAAPPVPSWLRGPDGAVLARAVVSLWAEHKQLKERQALFLRNNARRLALTMGILGGYKAECFDLLPYVLASRSFERRHASREEFPICRVSGYCPPFAQRGLALRHFQEFDPDPASSDGASPVRIEAIYTIGSVGSLAMTKASDIDYWICVHPQDATPQAIAALSRKLTLFSHWADETFGLEATFFVMDLDAVRRNDFGFSDKESSGSAQALLLKEEFYRTALKVCGRTLAWWLTPPGSVGEAGTERALRNLERASLGLVAPSVNMGGMADIPPEEFFGASLWQIIKALKSPFKSILKFALLEKYQTEMRGHGSDYQLCERIKESIVRQQVDMFATDPYAVLFKEVRDFYAGRGDTKSVELIRLAFLHKLDVTAANLAGAGEEGMQKRRFLEELAAQEGNGHDPAAMLAAWRGGVDQQIALGKQINAFMMHTYVRIQ
ncbi:MAG: class I adenylate cyclase, partial [Desulfovibrionaceae bacterium]